MRILILVCYLISLTGVAATPAPTKVAILFFDGVQVIDFAAPFEVFNQAKYEVFSVSKDGHAVTTAMDMKVNPDYSFSSFPPVDVIVVPGGNVHDAMSDKATLTGLTERSQSAQHTLSVCTGAFILAETGMLDGKIATNFHRALDNFARDYPNIRVIDDQRYTDNGKVITSAGLSSGIDASLHLVSKISGIEHAKTVAMHIEYDWRPEHPFVRAQMADRYLPHPDYEWPEEADFQRTYNYGDADHWQVAYLATTQMTPQQLSDTVKQAMRRLNDGWQLLPAEQPSTHTLSDQNYDLKWQRQQPEALIKLAFTLAPSKDDNQYKLIMTLDKRKPL